MRFKKGTFALAVFAFLLLGAGLTQVLAAPNTANCSVPFFGGFTDEEGKPVTITSATIKTTYAPSTATVPEYCYVTGTILPQIQFHVALPTAWNNRFYMPGGGGFNGSLPSLLVPLVMGYASAATDSGHENSDPVVAKYGAAAFAYNPPPGDPNGLAGANPYAFQEKIDFAYRSYPETALLAKKIITRYYGAGPLYSYWVGCSEGGREALMMAQRFPQIFNGIVAGSPILYLTKAHMWSVWNPYQLWNGVPYTPPYSPTNTYSTTPGQIMDYTQLPALAQAIYNKCDGLDGLVDGFIDDPRVCNFDATKDLPICATPSLTCFTMAQATAINRIHDGVRNSKGQLLFQGLPPGVEVLTRTLPTPDGTSSGWVPWILPTAPGGVSLQQSIGESSMQFFSLDYQPGPTWRFYNFNYDTDPQALLDTSDWVDMVSSDLSEFKARHGRMIHYAGWADPALTPLMTVNYYETVLKAMGTQATSDFYKLYMIPGMFHCSGGVACWNATTTVPGSNPVQIDPNGNQTKFFNAVVNWVETGTAPDTFIGTRAATTTGLTARTRPFCPYPEVARYGGSGSTDDATNFTCVPPITVSIDPNVLSLHSAVFTANITLPNGFEAKDWGISAVTCNGASATGGYIPDSVYGPTYAATFNTKDLVGVTPGNAVSFTVNLTFHQGGKQGLTQASTTVKVVP